MAWQRSPGVSFEVVEGKAVLLGPDGAELFTLNQVGTVVWEELDGRRDTAELVAALADRFDGVAPEVLERDVAAFLAELEASALVSRSAG